MQFTFDTQKIYRDLIGKGLFSEEQAEMLTDTLRDVVTLNTENLVTKSDLKSEIDVLRSEMRIMQQQLTIRLGGLMVAGIAALAALQQLG